MDKHQNLFYYYRGQSSKKRKDRNSEVSAGDKQLEDNTTKSLINTLELSRDGKKHGLLRYFIKDVCGLNLDFETAEFNLQVGQETSRPDASILLHGKSKTLILIESKLGSRLEEDQLSRHIKNNRTTHLLVITNNPKDETIVSELNKELESKKIIFTTWQIIYDSFQKMDKNELKSVANVLVNQFMEFLVMSNLTFDPLNAGADLENRIWQLRKLVEMVSTEVSLKLPDIDLPKRPKFSNYPGFGLGKEDAHYSVKFLPDCIGIGLTISNLNLKKLKTVRLTIINYLTNKLNSVEEVYKSKVTEEQSLLMRYDILAIAYRSISKAQTDKSLDTHIHQLNLYELVINKTKIQNSKIILEQFINNCEFSIRHDLMKQLEIVFTIRIPDTNKIEGLKKKTNDIRVLDYNLLSNSDNLVDAFVDFIEETNDIRKMV
jgi:hypothetical protein